VADRLTTAAVLLAAVVLAGGCLAPAVDRVLSGESAVPVWVVDHGWHTAIVVRRADVDPARWPAVADFPGATHVEVAWGDRDFYTAPSGTAWMAVKAALAAGGSVLHVAGFSAPVASYFAAAETVELRLSRGGFDAMTGFIAAEYAHDAAGRPIRVQPGNYGASWFYAARSRYHLFNTCNTWVARALRAGGLPVTPAGTITAAGVMQQVRDAARAP
jgi:uncharacterized protein (TIGR02117 family)